MRDVSDRGAGAPYREIGPFRSGVWMTKLVTSVGAVNRREEERPNNFITNNLDHEHHYSSYAYSRYHQYVPEAERLHSQTANAPRLTPTSGRRWLCTAALAATSKGQLSDCDASSLFSHDSQNEGSLKFHISSRQLKLSNCSVLWSSPIASIIPMTLQHPRSQRRK
jgi:hypothetical protein